MERRKFIKSGIVATSACTLLAGNSLAAAQEQPKTKIKNRCRVTVLRKEYYKEYYEEFQGKSGKTCPLFEVGQQFVINNWWECPEGFCEWAWADMRPFIQKIFNGKDLALSCCTDDFRPVIFKLERFKEEVAV